MAHFINPLLLDRSAVTTGMSASEMIATTARNFARSATVADRASFAQQLAAVAPAAATGATTTTGTSIPLTTGTPSTTSSPATEAATADKSDNVEPSRSARLGDTSTTDTIEDDDFNFYDALDIINPLQHIPIFGAMYREATGDEIKPISRIAGDVLFGAIVGGPLMSAVTAVVGAAAEQEIGEDPERIVANALFGPIGIPPSGDQPAPTMLATTEKPETPTPAATIVDAAPVPAAAPVPPVQTAKTQEIKPTAKAPYGGVMDMATVTSHPPIASALVTPQREGMRIGNVIYTSPTFNHAARIIPSMPTTAATATAPQPTMAEAKTISSLVGAPAGLSIPGAAASARDNSSTLGEMLGGPNRAAGTNSQLPPALVQDMMMMALDKYKAASGLAPSEMKPLTP